MGLNTVTEIERAIGTLSAREVEELYAWLDLHYPHPIDARIQSDIAAGRLDQAIERALKEEETGRVRPL